MDGKRMQDLYIHKMVSVEHIIWLTEMKKRRKKKLLLDFLHIKESKELDMHQTSQKKYSCWIKNKRYNNNKIINSYIHKTTLRRCSTNRTNNNKRDNRMMKVNVVQTTTNKTEYLLLLLLLFLLL